MQSKNYSDSEIKQLIVLAHEATPTDFIKYHKIKNESGMPIEFDDHAFMMDFYNDMSPLQVMLKAPQIGATVAEIIKTMWAAKKKGWDIIYTLPTQGDVQDMAGGKINRIVAQNPVFNSWVKDHDTVDQKAVGKNIIYYRGTFSQKQAMMVSSDLNVHDEVDASSPEVITQYETRLQAKADGRRWYFSHPSLAGFGVDKFWQQSDKKEWFITCPSCKKEQYLSFPENVDTIQKKYVCSACKEILTQECRRLGSWKPTNSGGVFSGYHVSQLMCPWISADKILNDFEQKDRQYFYNYVLGLPYASSDDKIDSQTVLKNVVDEVNDQEEPIVIGVDTGLPIHYLIGNAQGFFHYGECKEPSASYDPYDELEGFLKRWKKSIMVADQGGDLIGIRKLQAKYPGRVYLTYYRRDTTQQKMIKWGQGDDYGNVTVDRNRMIQMIVEQLKEIGRIKFCGSKEEWTDFANHFNNIYREFVVARNNIGKDDPTLYKNQFVWKRMGPDHFLHTLVYALTALDRFATMKAIIVQPGFVDELPKGRVFEPDDYAQ